MQGRFRFASARRSYACGAPTITMLLAIVGCSNRQQTAPVIDWTDDRPVKVCRPQSDHDAPEEAAPAPRSRPTARSATPSPRSEEGAAGRPTNAGREGGDAVESAGGRSARGAEAGQGADLQETAAGGDGASGSTSVGESGDGDPVGRDPAPVALPPALPGRGPRRPSMPPERAAEAATASLGRARSALRGGDVEQATQLALEAYEAAAPHAASSQACGGLCAEAGRMLESVARKQGRAPDQPTRFD